MFKWNSYRDNAHQKENEIKERKQKKNRKKAKRNNCDSTFQYKYLQTETGKL